MSDDAPDKAVRLDRWLWAARFFKTRAQATQAVVGGKVHVEGAAVKPGRRLRTGERLVVTRGRQRFEILVCALAERRGPAAAAQALYRETEASVAAREAARKTRELTRSEPAKRPGKRDRRQLAAWKRGRY